MTFELFIKNCQDLPKFEATMTQILKFIWTCQTTLAPCYKIYKVKKKYVYRNNIISVVSFKFNSVLIQLWERQQWVYSF